MLKLIIWKETNSSVKVSGWCLKVLDDLNSIGRYNWGVVVYETLASSLNRVAPLFCEGKNSSGLYIKGCALVLQVCYFMIIYTFVGHSCHHIVYLFIFIKL